MALNRVDAGDFGHMAAPLFDGNAAELFANSKIEPTPIERVVAGVIEPHRGRKNPISIAVLSKCTGQSVRAIKGIVHELVATHGIKIGAGRDEPVGYFMIESREDLEAAVGPYRSQILAMWRRLRVLLAPHELRELLGQLRLEETSEDSE